jgi:hypothetical protein
MAILPIAWPSPQVNVDGRSNFRVGSNVAFKLGGHSVLYNYRILATGVTRTLSCHVLVGVCNVATLAATTAYVFSHTVCAVNRSDEALTMSTDIAAAVFSCAPCVATFLLWQSGHKHLTCLPRRCSGSGAAAGHGAGHLECECRAAVQHPAGDGCR